MKNIKFVYKPDPQINLKGKEVVKIINEKPHLLLRLEISGDYFPHLGREPFVRIMHTQKKEFDVCWFAEVSQDNRSIYAYFPIDCKISKRVEYGYGNEVIGTVTEKFVEKGFDRLVKSRLEKGTITVTQKYLNRLIEKNNK